MTFRRFGMMLSTAGKAPLSMSALTPKADMCSALGHVRFVPIADILLTYSISSSARPISVFGMLRPSAFAVLRLITNSVFVDC